MSVSQLFELRLIRNRTSSPSDFEFTKTYGIYVEMIVLYCILL